MARKAQAEVSSTTVNESAIADAHLVALSAATLQQEAENRAEDTAELVTFDTPYVEGEVIAEAKYHLAKAQDSMLEFGRLLLVIRANTTGNFQTLVEQQFNIGIRSAQVMMSVTKRIYGNPQLAKHTKAIAQIDKRKIIDLLTLADEDVLAIVENNDANEGLTLSEVDRMTTREFKRVLAEKEAEAENVKKTLAAKDKVIANQARQLTELQEKKARVEPATPDDIAEELQLDIAGASFEVESSIRSNLRSYFMALRDHANQQGWPSERIAVPLAAEVHKLRAALLELESEFGLIGVLNVSAEPAWQNA